MKIKEAIEIINDSTITVSAKESNGFLHMYHRDFKFNANWFLEMPIDVTNWDYICSDWDCLSNIEPRDLARAMDVIQRLLDTPVEERFPEKKYCLRWFDDEFGKTFLGFCRTGGKKYWSTHNMQTPITIFTKSELEQLKKDNPRFAPAIDAMKEEVKDDED